VPALRETDRVLKLLADERATIRSLTRDADVVVGKLAANREDVGRFVAEARDTATASANRRADLAGTIRRLPAFERALRPTLADLGTAARLQAPALADLRAAAPDLTRLLKRLGPFATASRPAIRSLGKASVTGRSAVKTAAPTVKKLKTVAGKALEPSTNLRYVLEHLDDRANAAEPNAESPGGGKGFTGLEAFLQYPFVQSQAINLFDARGYSLKIDILVNDCGKYTNAAGVARDPARAKTCSGALGPNGPIGATTQRTTKSGDGGNDASVPSAPTTTPQAPSAPSVPATPPQAPSTGPLGLPNEIRIPGLPPIKLPDLGGLLGGKGGGGSGQRGDDAAVQSILDFLLKP
jgi:ABC-type transporter Mla subunit MlaD